MTPRPEPTNADKAEPQHLKPATPGRCPRPMGCICTWTPLDHGWSHGRNNRCRVCS